LWLGAIWLVLAAAEGSPLLFTAGQAALVLAMELGVTAGLSRTLWFRTAQNPFVYAWTLQVQGIAIGAYLLLAIVARIAVRRFLLRPAAEPGGVAGGGQDLLRRLVAENPSWAQLEAMLTTVAFLLAFGLGVYGAWPGVAKELGITNASPERVLGGSAYWLAYESPWGWTLLGVLAAVLTAGQWERFAPKRILALIVLVAAACLLLAAREEPQGAVASALRWYLAAWWLLGSLLLCGRERLARLVAPLGWPGSGAGAPALAPGARRLLLATALLPVL